MKSLFICQEFKLNVPRSERVRAIAGSSGCENNVILYFDNCSKEPNLLSNHLIVLHIGLFSKYTLFRDFCKKRSRFFLVNKFLGLVEKICNTSIKLDKWEFYHHQIVKSVVKGNFEQIIISVAPFSNLILCSEIRKGGYRGKLVLDIGDPLADNPALDIHNRVDLYKYEAEGIQHADGLIVTNQYTKNYYLKQYNYSGQIAIIPNGYWPSSGSFPLKLYLSYKRISAIYAGALYEKLRPIKPLLNVIKSYYDDMELVLISNHRPDFDANNIKYFPRMNHDELQGFYKRANLLVYIDNTTGIQTSSKLFELLSLGKPILFLYNFESENYLKAQKYPWVHFIRNEEIAISNFLTRDLLGKNIEYQPDYVDVKKYAWSETRTAYFKALNIV